MKKNFGEKLLAYVKFSLLCFKVIWQLTGGLLFTKNRESYLVHVVNSWAESMIQLFKIDLKIIGDKINFQPNRAYLIMSNHLSFIDIPLIYYLFAQEKIAMIAKKELFKIPLLGYGMRLIKSIMIDRKNPIQANLDLQKARRQMQEEQYRVWIAPEGTRSRTGVLGKLKRGGFKLAFDADAIIIPVTFTGNEKVWPAGKFTFGLHKPVTALIHPPIDSRDYPNNLPALMQLVEQCLRNHGADHT